VFSPRFTAALTTAVGAGAVGLAIATAGAAEATTTDEAFIAQMKEVGVTFSSTQAAVEQANQVCAERASGKTAAQIAREVLSQTNLTPRQASYFVDNAAEAYCPQYAGVLT
jgi:hypothetical protein